MSKKIQNTHTHTHTHIENTLNKTTYSVLVNNKQSISNIPLKLGILEDTIYLPQGHLAELKFGALSLDFNSAA